MAAKIEKPDGVIIRGLPENIEVREIDKERRSATFVAATENGVMTWNGLEYMRMSGARLNRFRKNPVVLDTHNRYEAGAIIGKATVKIEDKKLLAEITFAQTDRAEEIWQLVQGGFLKALSIGYMPDASKTKMLEAGDTDGEGEDMITGPASIVRQWELYEISVVPVPADAEALRRSSGNPDLWPLVISMAHTIERQNSAERKVEMENEKTEAEKLKEAEAAKIEQSKQSADVRTLEFETARAAAIHALVPRSLGERGMRIADELILGDANMDAVRKRFLAELAALTIPVGTPEPVPPQKRDAPAGKLRLAEISDEDFKRALTG
ncbi:MAG: HK97 family phage prohead protease [Nitrospirota bacterium]